MENLGQIFRTFRSRRLHHLDEGRQFGIAVGQHGDQSDSHHGDLLASRAVLVSTGAAEHSASSEAFLPDELGLSLSPARGGMREYRGGMGLGLRGSPPLSQISGSSALQSEGEAEFWDKEELTGSDGAATGVRAGASVSDGSHGSVLRMREIKKGKVAQLASRSSADQDGSQVAGKGLPAFTSSGSRAVATSPETDAASTSHTSARESPSRPAANPSASLVKADARVLPQTSPPGAASTEDRVPGDSSTAKSQDLPNRSLHDHPTSPGPSTSVQSASPANLRSLALSATHRPAVDDLRGITSGGQGRTAVVTRRRDTGGPWREAGVADTRDLSAAVAVAEDRKDEKPGQRKTGVVRTSTGGNAVCGGLAGAVVSVCIHPIDTVKTLIQSQRGKGAGAAGPILSRFIADRGIGGLYKGIAANLATSAPISAVYTSTYEAVKENMLHHLPPGLAPLAHCMAGACASVATSVIFTPSEAVKQRMQISTQYPNSLAALVGMARTEGIPSLYDGLGAVLARNIPNSIIKFLVYESLKKRVLQWQTERQLRRHRQEPGARLSIPAPSASLTTVNQLLVGGAAGSTAAFFTTPFDVIKTRMQTTIVGIPQYSGVADAFVSILRDEGVPGLYRGVVPRLLIYLSQGAIFFASYELLRRVLVLSPQREAAQSKLRQPTALPSRAARKPGREGELVSESL